MKTLKDLIDKETTDANVEAVITKYRVRARDGLVKYGVTTERTDLGLLAWLNHLQEELMDATIYLERIKQELKHCASDPN